MRGFFIVSGHCILLCVPLILGSSNLAIGAPSSDRNGTGEMAQPEGPRLLAEPMKFPPNDATLANRASITVLLPDPDAEVLVDGNKMSSTGAIRQFVSPPLEPGQFNYEIRASWRVDGTRVTHFRTAQVSPGSRSVVDFRPPNE
jgi:uncharacterized protein (TIGR03000 family)